MITHGAMDVSGNATVASATVEVPCRTEWHVTDL
jgi:hypothetical protein